MIEFSKITVVLTCNKNDIESFLKFQKFDYVSKNKFKLKVWYRNFRKILVKSMEFFSAWSAATLFKTLVNMKTHILFFDTNSYNKRRR